jgi:hypothetical protein
MPVILAAREAEIRRIAVQSQPVQIVCETISRKTLHKKIGLVDWLKVKSLSSSFSNTKKEKKVSRTKWIHSQILPNL